MTQRILYRSVGERELRCIARTGFRRFPPRLVDQRYFYPLCNIEYATELARDWNVRAGGAGYVTRFNVSADFLDGYKLWVGGQHVHSEYCIPAEDLERFNDAIVGRIEVIDEFYRKQTPALA